MLRQKLDELRKKNEEITGGWNGEDDTFTVNGLTYTEDEAHIAQDIIEAVDNLLDLLDLQNKDDSRVEYNGH